jgi:hypothetical protein
MGARIVSPTGYAKGLAKDIDRADEFHRLMSSGEQMAAGQYVAAATEEIIGCCNDMTSQSARNLAWLRSLDKIQSVGRRNARRRHQVQAEWCGRLHSALQGSSVLEVASRPVISNEQSGWETSD